MGEKLELLGVGEGNLFGREEGIDLPTEVTHDHCGTSRYVEALG